MATNNESFLSPAKRTFEAVHAVDVDVKATGRRSRTRYDRVVGDSPGGGIRLNGRSD